MPQIAFTAPHPEATELGMTVLREGGTASEAMVAAAAMVAVQYPHMNSLGGDGFWLISQKGRAPVAVDGCGAAALAVDPQSFSSLPDSGGGAAITMAGTVSGWQQALQLDSTGMQLRDLLEPAATAAEAGIAVTGSLAAACHKTLPRLQQQTHFMDIYQLDNKLPQSGQRLCNPALASTIRQLGSAGLDDFYRGELAELMAQDLAAMGSPLRLQDFHRHRATAGEPLSVSTEAGQLFNLGAPTQGLASLLILAIYSQRAHRARSETDHIHLLVEATKQAFLIRDREITDPEYLTRPLSYWLQPDQVQKCSDAVDLRTAMLWPHQALPGDTVWMGASDSYGTMVSFIQSIYWEFGSAAVLPATGITWNNRALSFSLDKRHPNYLKPGKKPFHTLNPAYAELKDGRRMVYGTMGGEGQPQTQACLFSRYLYQNMSLQQAVAEPRWLLGRTWGDDSHQLRLESSLYQRLGHELAARQHDICAVADNNELMGHAGAIVLAPDGTTDAAGDPRSDGYGLTGDMHE